MKRNSGLIIGFMVCFSLFSFFPSFCLAGQNTDKPLFLLTDESRQINITGNLKYYLDNDGSYSLSEVLAEPPVLNFIQNREETLNFGLTNAFVWLSFRVKNNSKLTDWILEFNTHKFYTVELFSGQKTHEISMSKEFSYKQSFSEREIKEAHLAFNLKIPVGVERQYYLKVKSENSLVIPLLLHSKENYFEKNTLMRNLWSAIYGILIVMFLYNIFIYFFLRDKNYLYYVIYVVFYIVYLSALSGLGAKYLWPFVSGRWTTIFSAIFGGLSLGVGCFLAREFLQTRIRNPLIDKTLIILAFLGGFLALVNLIFEKFMYAYIYGNVIGAVILLSITAITLISYLKGYKPALYFFLSYFVVIAGQLSYSLLSLGSFGDHFFIKNINQFAPVLQVVLLSLSLAYRFDLIRIEKDQALAAALKAETLLSENLEEKVQERTKELKAANKKLEIISNLDGLTGLYNRRYFDITLDAEWKRHCRSQLPLSIIICDIDHFKKFNDTTGHQSGDDCLCRIANEIKSAARRDSDIPARYGGEEFVVVLPQMDSKGGKKVAQSIAGKIDALNIPHPAFTGRSVTLSIGIATVVPTVGAHQETLIAAADKALYKSKKNGRNQITCSS
jgi:diguanylate cyclase (GGDEF)-like protein